MGRSVPAVDFTVAWICALPIELAAAAEMMDEGFDDLPAQPADTNIYTLGRIGEHNVVAACLPAGQMGTNQAATVTSQMRMAFPSLRFGVLVGIGGGVPRPEETNGDIRLGDVVISQPVGQFGGVVQYDFGRTGPGGRITRRGNLNTPPATLLQALNKLHSNQLRGKTQSFLTHLSKICSNPRFASPGPGQDILHNASSEHVPGPNCAGCPSGDVVYREGRATVAPELFFGTIASGNQVMADGLTRDQHSQELGGIMCFEMEAAGLMNTFPCLVIRGICDYADSHKNKKWQPYAAATAAACAKEVLRLVPPLMPSGAVELRSSNNVHFLVPFGQNESFVGRKAILDQLLARVPPRAHTNACQRTVVEGLGGVGKTQVAIETAYRVRDAHPDCSIFWLPAVNMDMFKNAYREMGRALGVPDMDGDKGDFKAAVKTALSHSGAGQWLLIVDNIDDPALLENHQLMSYIPSGLIKLDEFDESESVELLHQGLQRNQIGDDPEVTTKLLDHLAHLPLAIKQASAYLRSNTSVTLAVYLEYCLSSSETTIAMLSKDFTDQDGYAEVSNAVAKTWLISFERLSEDSPLAKSYLLFICCLAEKDIPMLFLPDGGNDIAKHEALSTLEGYAFLSYRNRPGRFDVHRLVRLAMRNWLLQHEDIRKSQVADTLQRLSAVVSWPTHGNRDEALSYIPHMQSALDFDNEGHSIQRAMLQTNMAECYYLIGLYGQTETLAREALALYEELVGREHPEAIHSRNQLDFALNAQGMYCESEEIGRGTLAILEGSLGPGHPWTLKSRLNLAMTMSSRGEAETASRMISDVLEMQRRVLGCEHGDTIKTMSGLAMVLSEQDKYEEAEALYREVLSLHKKVLECEDRETAESLSNLARVLIKQENGGEAKKEEAERLHREALALLQKTLSPNHPHTLTIAANLAIVLTLRGKHEEAEALLREILSRGEKVLGPNHPQTCHSRSVLVLMRKSAEQALGGRGGSDPEPVRDDTMDVDEGH